jgi:hypothetical protein
MFLKLPLYSTVSIIVGLLVAWATFHDEILKKRQKKQVKYSEVSSSLNCRTYEMAKAINVGDEKNNGFKASMSTAFNKRNSLKNVPTEPVLVEEERLSRFLFFNAFLNNNRFIFHIFSRPSSVRSASSPQQLLLKILYAFRQKKKLGDIRNSTGQKRALFFAT